MFAGIRSHFVRSRKIAANSEILYYGPREWRVAAPDQMRTRIISLITLMLVLGRAIPAPCQTIEIPPVSADFAARFRAAMAATPAAPARDPNKVPHTCEGFGAYAGTIVTAAGSGVPQQKAISDIDTNPDFSDHGKNVMRKIATAAYADSEMTSDKANALAKASCNEKSHLFRHTPSQIDTSE
ncbi:MAG: hypothetical protein ABSD30_12945 [Candidatus Binatus sp.]